MPVAGLEPARHRWQWILSPPRLPIPTHRQRCSKIPNNLYYITQMPKCQEEEEKCFIFCTTDFWGFCISDMVS